MQVNGFAEPSFSSSGDVIVSGIFFPLRSSGVFIAHSVLLDIMQDFIAAGDFTGAGLYRRRFRSTWPPAQIATLIRAPLTKAAIRARMFFRAIHGMSASIGVTFPFGYSGANSSFPTPHWGQTQSSGRLSNGVPGLIPASGSPMVGSYTHPHALHTYRFMVASCK
jgi:hypothetical protein